jgi:hypothetical protein
MFVNIPRAELEAPAVPAGDHPARIDKVTSRASGAGNQVLNLQWTISGTEPPAGQKVFDTITLVPDAYWKLQLLFAAIGYTPGEQGFQTEELHGQTAVITVVEDTYQGVTRAKVSAYKKAA